MNPLQRGANDSGRYQQRPETPCSQLPAPRYNVHRIIVTNRSGSTDVDQQQQDHLPRVEELRMSLAAAVVKLSDEQIEQLDHYRRLLWSWNERMNLTRHTTIEKFVGRDVVDSVELAKLLRPGERVLDVGTGGGVPGVILAILRPDLTVNLSESTQKKARAVEAMLGELGLDVPVYATRAEEVLEINTFDTLVARALAPLPKVLGYLVPHWDAFDRLLLIKGPAWAEERDDARRLGMLRRLDVRPVANYHSRQIGADSIIVSIRLQEIPS
jgi:16S rRNA (guanine527-N7)-methyltransferase